MTPLIASARRSFVCRSSASAKPRSANTLPVPRMIASSPWFVLSAFCFAMAGLVILLCDLQSSFDQVDIQLGGLDALGRFFLKGVKHVDDLLEAHEVDRPVSLSVMVFDQFEDTRALNLPGF